MHIPRMTTAPVPSSRACLARFIFLLMAMLLARVVPAQAAQETFWPFNLFPPPAWSLSHTDASPITVMVPDVGLITSRRFRLSGFINPAVLPELNASAEHINANTILDSETSLDAGANWAPYTGSGGTILTLRHTHDTNGVRRFEMEVSSQNIPVDGSYGDANVRTSPTQPSVGELVVTATNGGFLYRGYVNLFFDVSVDGGLTWFAFSPGAYAELSGPVGTPARLSILKSDTTVTICWRTEAVGEYQLQTTSTLGGTNWVSVGTPHAGNGSELCVEEPLATATNQFYRLQLSP